MENLARSKSELVGRLTTFLSSSSRGAEALALIDKLSAAGDVGIFGGMIRDFARAGSECFRSDIDLVVDADTNNLCELLYEWKTERNRFGGFRLHGRYAQFDVWTLRDTWAIREGIVEACSLGDLTKTTFFDWDAAVYMPKTSTLLYCEDYLDRIRSGVVTINLEQNPNPLGAIARTLRLLLDWEVGLSEKLADFLWKQLRISNPKDVVRAQKTTLGHVPLRQQSINRLRRKLSERDFFDCTFRYTFSKRQTRAQAT